MRKQLKRWYVWLALVLLLGLAGSTALIYSGQSRITQENFDRIHNGMSLAEVEAILGEHNSDWSIAHAPVDMHGWRSGPNLIAIYFKDDKVEMKDARFATALDSVKWHLFDKWE
jgi:hypothetical protein